MATEQEMLRVMEAMKATNDKRMFEHYQVTHLCLIGFKQKDISEIVLRSTKTVYSYIRAYRKDGLDGLERGLPTGAPRKLTESQEHELVQVVAYKTPHDIGFENHYNWTLAIIAEFIQREWGTTVCSDVNIKFNLYRLRKNAAIREVYDLPGIPKKGPK